MFLIAAMSTDRIIGRGGTRPWDVPEEFRQFLSFVEGQTVLLGRGGWELLGNDLNHSQNIVVSQTLSNVPGAEVVPSLEEGLALAWNRDTKIFCAGGARLFEQTLPLASKLYLSTIEGHFEGDAVFPALEEGEWEVERERQHDRFRFQLMKRRS